MKGDIVSSAHAKKKLNKQQFVSDDTDKVCGVLVAAVNPDGLDAGVVDVDVVEVAGVDGEAGGRLEERLDVLRDVLDSKVVVVEDVRQ